MNAEDAGSNHIRIDLNNRGFTATDKGGGFKNLQHIQECFETIGTPHALDASGYSTDAKFGTFRIGRGQIFAFASTSWRSGQFQMDVDVKNRGLDYTLISNLVKTQGCRIEGSFYDVLDPYSLNAAIKDLKELCEYCHIQVHLNEELVSRHPSTDKWDLETEDFYFRQQRGTRGLSVYNMGIQVSSMNGYVLGTGGTLVTKVPLRLNTARNQIQDSLCPNWKRIKAAVQKFVDSKIQVKAKMTEDECLSFISRLFREDTNGELWERAKLMPILRDVTGRMWKPIELQKQIALYNKKLAFAMSGDSDADKIMQMNAALVLDKSILSELGCNGWQFISKFSWYGVEYTEIEELAKHINDQYTLLNEKEITRREHRIALILEWQQWDLLVLMYGLGHHKNRRKIRIGKSTNALAWTDGSSYIAFNRSFLNEHRKMNFADWSALVQTLIHELLHDSNSATGHVHGPDFYRKFHDTALQAGPVIQQAMQRYTIISSDQRISSGLRTQFKQQLTAVLKESAEAKLPSVLEAIKEDMEKNCPDIPELKEIIKSLKRVRESSEHDRAIELASVAQSE